MVYFKMDIEINDGNDFKLTGTKNITVLHFNCLTIKIDQFIGHNILQ